MLQLFIQINIGGCVVFLIVKPMVYSAYHFRCPRAEDDCMIYNFADHAIVIL